MRVAVTGSAGFVGSHLVTCLREHGHDVVPVDIRAAPAIDMMNLEQLLDYLIGVDAIVHLAAEAYAERADEDPARAVTLNAVGTTNVLAAARKLGARVIYGSTIWVYGSTGSVAGQYDEHEPILVAADRHIYTTSKLAGELLTHDFVSMYGLQATILRFGIPYGVGMRDEAVLPRFCRAVLRGEPIELADGGRQGRQFIDVRDLAEGQRAALEAVETGPIYNLVSDEFTTIAQVAETVMAVAGKRAPIICRDRRRGDFSPGRLVSSRRAERDLGWRATISFADGVRDYWEWFCANAPVEPGAEVAARSLSGASSGLAVSPDTGTRWRVMFLGQGPLAELAYAQLLGLPEKAGLRVPVACSNADGHGTWWGTAEIRELADRHGARFVPNARKNDSLLARIAAESSINCLISVGHPWILSAHVLRSIDGETAFNLHNGLLPRFGGFNATSHAILEGAACFGSALHWMEPEPDAGPIAFQETFEIPGDATARSLHDLTFRAAQRLFTRLLDHLVAGRLPPRVPMTGPPTIYPPHALSEHREIADSANDVEVDRKSRAFWFPPFEPAFYRRNGKKYYVVPAPAMSDIAAAHWRSAAHAPAAQRHKRSRRSACAARAG